MKRFEFNKLVRDKLPDRMRQEGVVVSGKNLSKEDYIAKLKQKLMEESEEVLVADSDNEIKRELADVLEVISALADSCGISIEEIQKERIIKAQMNGYFSKDHYIDYIEVSEDNKKMIEYLENKYRSYVF